jgi:hypothetical protein
MFPGSARGDTVSILQLFMFDSSCRTDISGEDLSRTSIYLCKETCTGAAQAAIEKTRTETAQGAVEQTHPEAAQAAVGQTCPEAAQSCCRTGTFRL